MCHIACKRVGMKQIVVFDIIEEEENAEKIKKKLKSLKIMNFMNTPDPAMQVKISYNL